MTHGYRNIFGGVEDWLDLLTSGPAYVEAVAQDWIFGSAPVVPPVTGGWWNKRATEIRRRRIDDEQIILIGG